jgi:hypothetical protein
VDIGYIVMIALLGAGAAYVLTNKGKPRPTLTSGKKKILIACGIVLVPCLLVVMLVLTYPPQH